jgi:tetratricopeptide (TPR) repeat protein
VRIPPLSLGLIVALLPGPGLGATLFPGPALARSGAPSAAHPVEGEVQDPVLEAGEAHRAAWRPERAMAVWEAALAASPQRYAVLWRAAREATVLGMLEETEDAQNAWFRRGEDFARRAIAVDPEGVEGRYWLLAALGRRALQSGIVTTARLAGEIHAGATVLLEREPDHAGAHHVMGVLNSEVMKLPAVTRFLGRRVLGGGSDLYETSWGEAERHLARAVELDPGMLLYRLDLALMHLRRGMGLEASEVLRQLLDCPPLEAVDPGLQARARALLLELEQGV